MIARFTLLIISHSCINERGLDYAVEKPSIIGMKQQQNIYTAFQSLVDWALSLLIVIAFHADSGTTVWKSKLIRRKKESSGGSLHKQLNSPAESDTYYFCLILTD